MLLLSLLEGECCGAMAPQPHLRAIVGELLADSVTRPLPSLTTRRVPGKLRFPGKVTAVMGVRRAGKTTFLHQIRSEAAQCGTTMERLPYVSFEDERLAGMRSAELGTLIEEYCRQFPDPSGDTTVTWFFDEIQVIDGWERFVRRLLDTGGIEVFVTGSSASLLSREIATALRGRGWQVLLHPFSFEEALRYRGHEMLAEPEPLTSSGRFLVEREFVDWLRVGGFPEAQDLDTATRRQLLRDYVDVAMFRDVVERHDVRNVTGLRWLVRHLLGNAGSMFSVERFHSALKSQGVAIAKDTVHLLLAYLEDCFLVRVIWMESKSERQRMVNPRKAYPIDTGLIPLFDRTGRSNLGHALETAVLIELERRRFEVTYMRTPEGYEIDFVARGPNGETELIQVCTDLSDPRTASRELRALASAARLVPRARQLVLTLTRDGFPADVPSEVEVQTAYEWALGSCARRQGRHASRAMP